MYICESVCTLEKTTKLRLSRREMFGAHRGEESETRNTAKHMRCNVWTPWDVADKFDQLFFTAVCINDAGLDGHSGHADAFVAQTRAA